MPPAEVTEKLQLSKLKDRVWYVVPSCATTGEGLFEGLVSSNPRSHLYACADIVDRVGSPQTSRLRLRLHASNMRSDHQQKAIRGHEFKWCVGGKGREGKEKERDGGRG